MNIFSETWSLAKMLFSDINKVDDVETYLMTHYPFSGYKYMMWCGKLIYRDSRPQYKDMNPVDWNHESIHLAQAKDCGSWFKFYLFYLWHWIKHNPFTKRAYYINRYEIEAYAKEDDFYYLDKRQKNDVKKFELENASELFKQHRLSYYFKNYIKNYYRNL